MAPVAARVGDSLVVDDEPLRVAAAAARAAEGALAEIRRAFRDSTIRRGPLRKVAAAIRSIVGVQAVAGSEAESQRTEQCEPRPELPRRSVRMGLGSEVCHGSTRWDAGSGVDGNSRLARGVYPRQPARIKCAFFELSGNQHTPSGRQTRRRPVLSDGDARRRELEPRLRHIRVRGKGRPSTS